MRVNRLEDREIRKKLRGAGGIGVRRTNVHRRTEQDTGKNSAPELYSIPCSQGAARSAPSKTSTSTDGRNVASILVTRGGLESYDQFVEITRSQLGDEFDESNWQHVTDVGDFGVWLEKLAPAGLNYRHHQTGEDNADAHLKRTLMGHQVILPITAGKLDLGPWEQVFYAEFDGQRKKRVVVKVMGE